MVQISFVLLIIRRSRLCIGLLSRSAAAILLGRYLLNRMLPIYYTELENEWRCSSSPIPTHQPRAQTSSLDLSTASNQLRQRSKYRSSLCQDLRYRLLRSRDHNRTNRDGVLAGQQSLVRLIGKFLERHP